MSNASSAVCCSMGFAGTARTQDYTPGLRKHPDHVDYSRLLATMNATVPARRFGGARAALLVAAALVVSGCVHDDYRYAPYTGASVRYNAPYYYDYHYYPTASVYFHLYTGRYYYRSGGSWARVRVLPSRIHIGPHDRIHLRIWADRPYKYWDNHRKRFHPHPRYQRDRQRDRFERRYNRQHHHRYLKRYRH